MLVDVGCPKHGMNVGEFLHHFGPCRRSSCVRVSVFFIGDGRQMMEMDGDGGMGLTLIRRRDGERVVTEKEFHARHHAYRFLLQHVRIEHLHARELEVPFVPLTPCVQRHDHA